MELHLASFAPLPAPLPTQSINEFEVALQVTYFILLVPLALLGMHRAWMVILWAIHRKRHPEITPIAETDLPTVNIQLPIYNERYVAARLIESVAKIDYPRNRLKIQVLDDSTDETVQICERAVEVEKQKGLNIEHVRRPDRVGYKAGALEYGLERDDSEFVAVFDADFVPPIDFLRRTLPHFYPDHNGGLKDSDRVGMVQTRWGHLNADDGLLTETQATLLDGHFLVEHVARSRSGYFFNFNGTGGVFRRAAIDDAGGWQHDTITEDLDLSYRSQLRGWKFVYDPTTVCPAELPPNMNAFQTQQYRWAKGAIQVGRKLLGRICTSPIGLRRKIEANVHLLGNFAFPLILAVVLVGLPLQLVRYLGDTRGSLMSSLFEASPLFGATFSVFLYYGVASVAGGRKKLKHLVKLPWLVASGAALSVNNTLAVIAAFDRDPGEFVRTPKQSDQKSATVQATYRSRRGVMPRVEIALSFYALATSVLSFMIGMFAPGFFHGLFAFGLFWAGFSSLRADRIASRQAQVQLSSSIG
ncbi:MAG: glycosyltransferase [Planctomycetota bacterium]